MTTPHQPKQEASFVQPVTTEGTKFSYRIKLTDNALYTAATDILVLTCAANKTLRVTRAAFSADATAASSLDFYVIRRTIANTGGTSAAATITPHDSTNPACVSTALVYTAAPTISGSGAALFDGDHYALPAAASTGYPVLPLVYDYGVRNNQSLILNAGEAVAINFGAQAVPAGTSAYITLEFTEEAARTISSLT